MKSDFLLRKTDLRKYGGGVWEVNIVTMHGMGRLM